MTQEEFSAEYLKVEDDLRKAQIVCSQKKQEVDACAKAREEAGYPRQREHPTVQAHNKALQEYDSASMMQNEVYGKFVRLKANTMMFQSATKGTVDAVQTPAKTSMQPDVEEISRRETARLKEEWGRKHPGEPMPGEVPEVSVVAA